MPPCRSSHPPLQKGWKDWPCPRCGFPVAVCWRATDAEDSCGLLHAMDQIECTNPNCMHTAFGNVFVKAKLTSPSNTCCPHCSGRGYTYGKVSDTVTYGKKKKIPVEETA